MAKVPTLEEQITLLAREMLAPADIKRWPGERFRDWYQIASLIVTRSLQRQERVIGISGSQGSGKSTLANVIVSGFQSLGVSAVALSLDDFYLTRESRQLLAKEIHPLLKTRGVPGTHDHAWLGRAVADHRAGRAISVPRFNKGIDDREGTENHQVDFLVVEGWCLGVQPQAEGELVEPVNDLERIEDAEGRWRKWVNAQIPFYQPIWSEIDVWLQLKVPSFDQVYAWRSEQEQSLDLAQRMTASELHRFIEHYERITRHLWASPALSPGITVGLKPDHRVATIESSE